MAFDTHIEALVKNLQEVDKLVEIHSTVTGEKRGNRASVNVLNKSGIVLAVACWEAFVEDLAKTAFEKMLIAPTEMKTFPKKVRILASKSLIEDKDEGRVWDLAGDGWKKVIKQHKDKILQMYVGSFNTAKTKRIDDLFEDLIGLKSLSKNWTWRGSSNAEICMKLDKLVTRRGEIAHRFQATKTVLKSDVKDATEFINGLAAITSNRVSEYVQAATGKPAWDLVQYGNEKYSKS